MQQYLMDQLWTLPQWQSRHEIVLSLLLELVGSIAQAITCDEAPHVREEAMAASVAAHPRSSMSSLLMHGLYVVLEHTAGHRPMVHQAAMATLTRLAFHSQYESVSSLLVANMDYVVDILRVRMTQLGEYPQTPHVVEGLLQYGATPESSSLSLSSFWPFLEDTITSVLSSVDHFMNETTHTLGLLRVLHVIVTSQAKPERLSNTTMLDMKNESGGDPSQGPLSIESAVAQKWTVFAEDMQRLFHPDDACGNDHDDDNDHTDTLDTKRPPPPSKLEAAMPVEYHPENEDEDDRGMDHHETNGQKDDHLHQHPHHHRFPKQPMRRLLQEILIRCAYFMAAPDIAISCLACRVLTYALVCFPPTELHPLLHRLWPLLLKRLEAPSSSLSTSASTSKVDTMRTMHHMIAKQHQYPYHRHDLHHGPECNRPPVILAAVQCLETMAGLAGDFLSDRFVESAWPLLKPQLLQAHFIHDTTTKKKSKDGHDVHGLISRSDLQLHLNHRHDAHEHHDPHPGWTKKLASAIEHNTVAVPYRPHGVQCQLQEHVLTCLDLFCRASDGLTSIVADVAATTLPFLRDTAPESLQAKTRMLFVSLARLNSDELFPMLAALANLALPRPPAPIFPSYDETAMSKIHDVRNPELYEANARALLAAIHSDHFAIL